MELDPLNTLNQALKELSEISDPTDQATTAGQMLAAIPEVQSGLREIRQHAVIALRAQGLSHAEVGKLLGLSRGRAQQIAEGVTTHRRGKAERAHSGQPDEV